MRYNVDFSEDVIAVAEKYVNTYHSNIDVRMEHKNSMSFFFELGKDVTVFKQIADCIEAIMLRQDQLDAENQ